MPDPKTPPKGKGASAFLQRKVFGMPMWLVLALGTVATWYIFKKIGKGNAAASTTQAAVQQPATDTTGLTGGPGTSGDMTGAATSAGVNPTDLLNALGQQNANLLGLLSQQLSTQSQGVDTGGYQPAGVSSDYPPSIVSTSTQPGGSNAPTFHYTPVSSSAKNFAKAAVKQTASAKTSGKTSAFGGVTSVQKTKSGATITTYASGRRVEQAPGKTAYVIHR